MNLGQRSQHAELERLRDALGWLTSQYISDSDPQWIDHVFGGLALEDPAIYQTINEVYFEDAGEHLVERFYVIAQDGGGQVDGFLGADSTYVRTDVQAGKWSFEEANRRRVADTRRLGLPGYFEWRVMPVDLTAAVSS